MMAIGAAALLSLTAGAWAAATARPARAVPANLCSLHLTSELKAVPAVTINVSYCQSQTYVSSPAQGGHLEEAGWGDQSFKVTVLSRWSKSFLASDKKIYGSGAKEHIGAWGRMQATTSGVQVEAEGHGVIVYAGVSLSTNKPDRKLERPLINLVKAVLAQT
jgi:hypothetical protein